MSENLERRPLCPYCRTEFSDENMNLYTNCAEYDSGTSHEAVIEIHCDKCKRLVYKKDGY